MFARDSDAQLYADLTKREERLKKKKIYSAQYAKTYTYPNPEKRKQYQREFYYASKKLFNPLYKPRMYKKNFIDKGESIKTIKKEEKFITLSFD